MSEDHHKINIFGEPTSDPQVCRFTVNRTLYPDGTVTCNNIETAKGSPMLEALFAIDGIGEVLVSGSHITIAKSTDEDWPAIGKKIGAAIRGQLESGRPLFAANLKERKPSEKELRTRVEELLRTEVNPYVAGHGGNIDVVDVRDTTVYVTLSGGCQGCGAANVTLKQGVERIILEQVPQVSEVVDITDHAAGTNPYYD